jgi:hypothetical protein
MCFFPKAEDSNGRLGLLGERRVYLVDERLIVNGLAKIARSDSFFFDLEKIYEQPSFSTLDTRARPVDPARSDLELLKKKKAAAGPLS